ncbi:MAG: hypothetical protein EBU46_16420 [Nitrosomonadaceae bacterium]|nr:hypothetical protein [Nitrosomonadaceae bacterium]
MGALITGATTLPTPFAQFYLVNSPVGSYQITLPLAAHPTCKGATVTFRRDNSTPTNLTFGRSGSDLLYPANDKDGVSSITFTAAQFQTQFISDGASWYQVYVA